MGIVRRQGKPGASLALGQDIENKQVSCMPFVLIHKQKAPAAKAAGAGWGRSLEDDLRCDLQVEWLAGPESGCAVEVADGVADDAVGAH